MSGQITLRPLYPGTHCIGNLPTRPGRFGGDNRLPLSVIELRSTVA